MKTRDSCEPVPVKHVMNSPVTSNGITNTPLMFSGTTQALERMKVFCGSAVLFIKLEQHLHYICQELGKM